jgi:hypothetical protein
MIFDLLIVMRLIDFNARLFCAAAALANDRAVAARDRLLVSLVQLDAAR